MTEQPRSRTYRVRTSDYPDAFTVRDVIKVSEFGSDVAFYTAGGGVVNHSNVEHWGAVSDD